MCWCIKSCTQNVNSCYLYAWFYRSNKSLPTYAFTHVTLLHGSNIRPLVSQCVKWSVLQSVSYDLYFCANKGGIRFPEQIPFRTQRERWLIYWFLNYISMKGNGKIKAIKQRKEKEVSIERILSNVMNFKSVFINAMWPLIPAISIL